MTVMALNTTVLTGGYRQIECLAVSGYLGGNMNYDPTSQLEKANFNIINTVLLR
jgi:hypothetical protein